MVSSTAYIWFGIPGKSMQWVPAPKAGFQRNWTGNVETLALEDGRQAINVSSQKHTQFVGDFFGDYTNPDGVNLDVFNSYATGIYGRGPIVFANPYAFQTNLFAPHWASPSLIEQGWSTITDATQTSPVEFGSIDPTYGFGRPPRYAIFPITTAAFASSSAANQYNHYIAIPPGYVLNIGASAVYSGDAAIVVQPYFAADNTADTITVLDPISYQDANQMNATFDGDTYNAVRVFLTRSSEADASILLYSMMAQLIPNTGTLSLNGHIAGQGHLGLKIVGSAIAETYNYGGTQKGLNLTLEETI